MNRRGALLAIFGWWQTVATQKLTYPFKGEPQTYMFMLNDMKEIRVIYRDETIIIKPEEIMKALREEKK